MKIIVCGAGPVGAGIARQLANEGNDVTVLDNSPEQIQEVNETLDVTAYRGFPSHPPVLENAGASDADMIIAVTNSDETNMVICQVAHSIFNIQKKIARIRHKNYLMPIWKDLYRHEHLPIDHIISPENEVAAAIINRLHVPGATDSIPMGNDRLKVIEVRVQPECPLIGQPLGRIEDLCKHLKMSVLSIMREQVFIPFNPKEKLEPGDEIYFVAASEDVPDIMEIFGVHDREARRILIVGGGNIGYFIAQQLAKEDHRINIKIIELNEERAQYLAGKLSKITVINGNSLDQDILFESNIEQTETVISVSNDDEVNILTSLLAKRSGAKRSVALVNKGRSYSPLISSLGIDVMVNPREMTVSSVLQYTRKGKIISAHSICSGAAEVLEVEAFKEASIVGRSVDDLELPKSVKVGAIVRDEMVIIPNRRTSIHENDRVVLMTPTEFIGRVDKVLSSRHDYF